MAQLEFSEIIELVNSSRIARISPQPVKKSPGFWELYSGQYHVHATTVPFDVLYLFSRAQDADLKQAHRDAFRPGETQVVYASSRATLAQENLFKETAKGYWSAKAYVASFFQEEISVYPAHFAQLTPNHFL